MAVDKDKKKHGLVMVIAVGGKPPKKPEKTADVQKAAGRLGGSPVGGGASKGSRRGTARARGPPPEKPPIPPVPPSSEQDIPPHLRQGGPAGVGVRAGHGIPSNPPPYRSSTSGEEDETPVRIPMTEMRRLRIKEAEERAKRGEKDMSFLWGDPPVATGEPMDTSFDALKSLVRDMSPASHRHKLAYDSKYEQSPKRVKYREQLNRERRRRGIYGRGGPDVSHTQHHKLVLENPHANRGRNKPGRSLKPD